MPPFPIRDAAGPKWLRVPLLAAVRWMLREDLVVAAQRSQVIMPGDRPIARAVRLRRACRQARSRAARRIDRGAGLPRNSPEAEAAFLHLAPLAHAYNVKGRSGSPHRICRPPPKVCEATISAARALRSTTKIATPSRAERRARSTCHQFRGRIPRHRKVKMAARVSAVTFPTASRRAAKAPRSSPSPSRIPLATASRRRAKK